MPRKEDEIMAEYLLKGGKMLEKCCKTCGCPLFEYKKKTFCVVCAEREAEAGSAQTAKETKGQAAPAVQAHVHAHGSGQPCTCGDDAGREPCEGGMLGDELAMTLLALCQRIQNEKDPNHVLTLMNAVKAGTEALVLLCQE